MVRKAFVAAAACALVAGSPQPAFADTDFKTGNGMLSFCKAKQSDTYWLCAGRVEGLTFGLDIGTNGTTGKRFFCIPPGVTNGQKIDVVIKYLEDNPSTRHAPWEPLVMLAITAAWPCDDQVTARK